MLGISPSHLYSDVLWGRKLQISKDIHCLVLAQMAPRNFYMGQKSQSKTDVTLDWFSILGHKTKRAVLTEGAVLC